MLVHHESFRAAFESDPETEPDENEVESVSRPELRTAGGVSTVH